MSIPGMPYQVTMAKRLAEEVGEKSLDAMSQALLELDRQRKLLKKQINKQAAYERAAREGLKPIDQYRDLKQMINEHVIETVKKERLRHIDVADFSMVHRPRVTHIMNRHLNKVSIDCMFKILSALGVKIEVKFG